MINIRSINKEEWNNFIENCEDKQFFHCWDYHIILKNTYKKIKGFGYFGLYEDNTLMCIQSFYILNNKLVCNGTPLLKDTSYLEYKINIIEYLKKYTKENKLIGIFIDNYTINQPKKLIDFKEITCKNLVLNLTSVADIWKSMPKKTRNSIKSAEKHNIQIFKSDSENDIIKFSCLHDKMWDRKNLELKKSIEYWLSLWKIFKEDNNYMELYLALYNGEIISGTIVYKCNKKALYAHNASKHEYRNLNSNSLVQWQIIKDLIAEGYKTYEMGEISLNSKDKQSSGIAHFKMSFGGQLENKTNYYLYNNKLFELKDRIIDKLKLIFIIIKRNII